MKIKNNFISIIFVEKIIFSRFLAYTNEMLLFFIELIFKLMRKKLIKFLKKKKNINFFLF
jgi:hypothetical protein